MRKELKYFTYLLACLAIFFVFVRVFGGSLSSNSASAFEWQKQVNVYFGNHLKGSDQDCSKVFPVSRTILNAETLGPGALEALLKGEYVEGEQMEGYFSSINDGVKIQKFEITDRVAYVDFNATFTEGVSGSCRITAIKSQIENTLNNLPDIDAVVISVNNQTGVLEP